MSNKKRKTRKQKIIAEKKRNEIRKSQKKELQMLKNAIIKLESDIKLQKKINFKQFNIRNLKVLANTGKFLTPFVISTGITVGVFCFFSGGLPFHLDEITTYKFYSMEMQQDGHLTMDNKYIQQRWFDDAFPSNSLVVYTPWKLMDGQYVRAKRDYDIDKLATLDLYNAIANKNYDYISENLNNYKEERQVLNEIYLEEKNDYVFEASLYLIDKNDVLKYHETDFKNIIITIIELVLGLGIGSLVAFSKANKCNFLYRLEMANRNYKVNISLLKSMQKELEDTKEKVLSLTKTKGENYNE